MLEDMAAAIEYATDAAAELAANAAAEADPWARLAQARTGDQLCAAWLGVLCRRLVKAQTGLLLLGQADGAFAPVAAYPPDRELSHLRAIATDALRTREVAQHRDDTGGLKIAYPLLSNDRVCGAVVLEPGSLSPDEVVQALQILSWGAGWLVGLLHQRDLTEQGKRLREGGFLLDTVLGLQAERTPREAALSLVNRVGREFDSSQAHLALLSGAALKLQALSHAAWFEDKAGVLVLATQAMHEALDQRRSVVWPNTQADPLTVTLAHQRYAEQAGAKALLSVPLSHEGGFAAVLMLERGTPFSADEVSFLESLAVGVAPVLFLQREAHMGAARRAARTAREGLGWWLGPRHAAAKLGLGVAALVILLLAVVPVPFRVSAQALVEGAVQRAVVAPFEGYLREAPARAGDLVKAGQILATLDDRDLRLERVRWESELEVAQRKEREAMASGNAVEQRLAGAQANQARAQLDLALSRLERAAIAAPFDGTVVKGDLTQQLGSPVEQGKVLFELAPLDAWRVILKVDERDIGHVKVGAPGQLVLSSVPGQAWPFTVKKLTPVSVPQDGRNHFRVEAELAQGAPRLSPNMEGVGKVSVGQASLLWIWTRPLVEWARLAWWKWAP